MTRLMRGIVTALLSVFLMTALAACKSPPPHTDSTRGTTRQDRDTGMHDNQM
jgi:hypothetical protein